MKHTEACQFVASRSAKLCHKLRIIWS